MKTSKSDTSLIPDENNIIEKGNSKRLGKNKLKSSILQQQEECLWQKERDRIFIEQLRCFRQGLNNPMRLYEKLGENDKTFEREKKKYLTLSADY